MSVQLSPFSKKTCDERSSYIKPYKKQLLKWVGNKQKFAYEILSYFPDSFNTYYEPFVGSGGVLATLAPNHGIASDTFKPLVDLWIKLKTNPEELITYWTEAYNKLINGNKIKEYDNYKNRYRKNPNCFDLLVISRTCYGGVIRFRKEDGGISTPCGVHKPMPPKNFSIRTFEWQHRLSGTQFFHSDFEPVINKAGRNDIVYCDPPYIDSQKILYGAQDFSFDRLIAAIKRAKDRGAKVALSIDGTKKSGKQKIKLDIPKDIFERKVFVNCGRSMLRRFQMEGQSLEKEVVADRLLLTW